MAIGEGKIHDRVFSEIQMDLPFHVAPKPKALLKLWRQFSAGQRLYLRLNHRGPGVFVPLQLLQPAGKGLFVTGQIQTLCCVSPVFQRLLMLAGNKTHLLFGGRPKKGNHPEQHQGSQRQGA